MKQKSEVRKTKKIADREEPIGAVFHCVSNAIRRGLDGRIAAEISPELSGARGMVLNYIVRHNEAGEPVYQRDIETRFHIRRSSVTVMLQGMEQSGYITRCSVKSDARLKSLAATEKGLACNDAIGSCIRRYEEALRSGMTAEQIDTVYLAVNRIMDNLQQMETEGKEGT